MCLYYSFIECVVRCAEEIGEKWAIIRESTLKIRIKLDISLFHETLALSGNIDRILLGSWRFFH